MTLHLGSLSEIMKNMEVEDQVDDMADTIVVVAIEDPVVATVAVEDPQTGGEN